MAEVLCRLCREVQHAINEEGLCVICEGAFVWDCQDCQSSNHISCQSSNTDDSLVQDEKLSSSTVSLEVHSGENDCVVHDKKLSSGTVSLEVHVNASVCVVHKDKKL